MSTTSEILLEYLNDVLSSKPNAELDIKRLDKRYAQFGKALVAFANRQPQQEAEGDLYHDPMTNVFNRFYGMRTLHDWLDKKKPFALIFVNMDNLKYINGEFGRSNGDKCIINTAKYLGGFSNDAMLCRVGGDEFMLLVPNMNGDDARERMDEIQESMQNDEYLKDKEYTYSISYGTVAVYENNELPASDILSTADERLYENKQAKKKKRKASRRGS